MSKKPFRTFIVCIIISAAFRTPCAGAESSGVNGHWVSTWSTAVHAPLPFPGLPPAPVFENQTIRMILRPSLGGQRVRIRFSNAFGASPLTIGAAHIALAAQGSKIVPESDHALTFGGKTSVIIPQAAPMLSDPVDLTVSPLAELAVSVYLPNKTPASTGHFWAQHETYFSGPGDSTAKPDIAPTTKTGSWYWLEDAEVWAPERTGVTVALGDSITDGAGAKQGEYKDWPDMLAKRLAGTGSPTLGIVNEGIGGNRILHDGAGISALARFDRDVLAQPGVVNLILLEGINDIGWPHMRLPKSSDGAAPRQSLFAGEAVSAQELIVGLQQIIERAHEHHIRVFGATLTPFEGADYYTEEGEGIRQAVNNWIRTGGAFDGVFDFDSAVRDPAHPAQFREGFHSGDHLHPSAIGYKAMADSIDLGVLSRKTNR